MFKNAYREYFIVMADYDTFIIKIHDNISRLNNPDDDQLIEEYMRDNYYGNSYEVIDRKNIGYEIVDIR